MAWSSLPIRIAISTPLPLILCGPLLRRTEANSVTVWLALKEPRANVTLNVYEGDSRNGDTNPKVLVLHGQDSTIALGDHIHVVAVTAHEATSAGPLIPDRTYCYDLTFGNNQSLSSIGVYNDTGNLRSTPSTGIIPEIIRLCYGESTLPTFELPTTNLSELQIIHSSCRKPHGGIAHAGEEDALALVDNIISSKYDIAGERPHQLYHTGDQIYADDVAGLLLYMLHDAAMHLLGWVEKLPDTLEEPDATWPDQLRPGNRWNTLKILTKFSVDISGSSHLMRLGEFYCMYLFVWSDILWPVQFSDMPSFNDVYPDATDTVGKEYKGLTGHYIEVEPSPQKITYDTQINLIWNFSRTLKKVRRSLANIPSYMMCDDHEITDDWFISWDWVRLVYGYQVPDGNNPGYYPESAEANLGRRIIQNGLSAFNVFQAWGNKPASYKVTGSPESNLLANLVKLHTERGMQLNTWKNIRSNILPVLSQDGQNHKGTPMIKLDSLGMPDYSFSIVYDKFILIALNSRTERSFVTHLDDELRSFYGPALINKDAMQRQITDCRKNILMHSSPGPFGLVEIAMVICPAPVIGHPFVEGVLQHGALKAQTYLNRETAPEMLATYYGIYWDEDNDREAWSFNQECMESLLKELSLFEKVVLFCGDVHYGFSASISYNNNRPPSFIPGTNIYYPLFANIVQLVASSMKNSTIQLPQSTYWNGEAKFFSVDGKLFHFAGWNKPGTHTTIMFKFKVGPIAGGGIIPVEDKSNFFISEIGVNDVAQFIVENEIYYTDIANDPPQWMYTVEFGLDRRPYLDRISFDNSNLPAYNQDPFTVSPIERAYKNLRYSLYLRHDAVVGYNQVSQVKLNWNVDKHVSHHFWYKVRPTANPGQLTIHALKI